MSPDYPANAIMNMMQQAIFLLCATAALEIVTHILPPSWQLSRRASAGMAFAAGLIAAIMTLFAAPLAATILLAIVYAYRLFNMARIIRGRMHQQYLWRVTYATTLRLVGMQFLIIAAWYGLDGIAADGRAVVLLAVAIQILVAALMLQTIRGHERRMRLAIRANKIMDAALPSLTVAIPARNETAELQDCITSLLACHYPKLEILVLDDCSQERRTPEIIRSFAHDGVRFIKGREPEQHWLAKNQAYDELARQSSGEYLLFCGVDVRFEPGSLRQIVAYAVEKQKSMVCLMPVNRTPAGSTPLIQPMRYLWELALPRKLFNKPPVLSTAWLITRQSLEESGGFKAARRMVVPEAHFAAQTLRDNRYSFLASGDVFGISSNKTVADQRDTAIRVSYPSLHRRPQTVAVVGVLYAAWIIMPLLVLMYVLQGALSPAYIVVAATPAVISAVLYGRLLGMAYGKVRIRDIVAFPVAAAMYVGLINYSMYKYEFSEVVWKGRNVCIPVMHVVPSLPKF